MIITGKARNESKEPRSSMISKEHLRPLHFPFFLKKTNYNEMITCWSTPPKAFDANSVKLKLLFHSAKVWIIFWKLTMFSHRMKTLTKRRAHRYRRRWFINGRIRRSSPRQPQNGRRRVWGVGWGGGSFAFQTLIHNGIFPSFGAGFFGIYRTGCGQHRAQLGQKHNTIQWSFAA